MDEEKGDSPTSPWLCSCRLGLAIMAFVGLMGIYMQRVGMSVAIVCMVNHTALRMEAAEESAILGINSTILSSAANDVAYALTNHTLPSSDLNAEEQCTFNSSKSEIKDGPFVWRKEMQGHLLGAFFYGYLVSQVPAGMLAERFGGKWIFTVFYLISTLGTLLTPVAARIHYGVLLAMRVLVGIGSGAIFPVMHSIWGNWAPPNERTKLTGISYAGAMMGNVIALPLSGILCDYGFDDGWGSIFYIFGLFSLLWTGLWVFLVGDSPASCKRISPEEKHYINHCLKGQVSEDKKGPPVPWLTVFRSGPVWAIIVCNFATDWGLYTFLTNIPTYMFEVLKFDMQSNGLFSALPFIALWANMNCSPIIADKLMSSKTFSTTVVRKLFNSVGMFGSAIFLVGLAFLNCTQSILAVAMISLGVGVMGSAYSGFLVNHMDIAPKFAGSLFGLTNCIGASSGFVAPNVAAALTKNQSREEWQMVFFITAGIMVAGNLVYLLLGSGELQPWAVVQETEEEEPMKSLDSKKKEAELNGRPESV